MNQTARLYGAIICYAVNQHKALQSAKPQSL